MSQLFLFFYSCKIEYLLGILLSASLLCVIYIGILHYSGRKVAKSALEKMFLHQAILVAKTQ